MNLLGTLSRELEQLVGSTTASVVGIEHRRGHGSGMVLAPDGYVLTNAHVVEGARTPEVRLATSERVGARVVGADPRTDLAVVQAEARELPALAFAPRDGLKVGQLVVAIGNPLRFERSVSLGVVSAIDRSLPGRGAGMMEGLVQTDAAINPGNSGGPLLDVTGRVVGINTAIIPWAQGMGFAVPSWTASWVAAVLIHKGEVRRRLLGVAARSEALGPHARAEGQARGVRILGVSTGSPADAAGLRSGDVLLRVDRTPVLSVDDLQRVLVLSEANEFELELLRDGREARTIRPVARLAA
ncbi:MAG: S1C family serine protease [Myxococcales bacterium]